MTIRLDFFEKLVRESQCLKKCKSENLEPHMHDSRVMPSVDEDFDHLKPYSYLQFCYYKVEYFFFCNSRACFTSEKDYRACVVQDFLIYIFSDIVTLSLVFQKSQVLNFLQNYSYLME
jgi:hypothetical protein